MTPRRTALMLAAGAGLALLAVWLLGDRPPGWYPPCPSRLLTGLHCPGCGTGRAVHALVHGEFARALALNPLLVVALPPLALWTAWNFWRAVRHDRPAFALPHPAAAVVLTVLVLYWIARNLPWWPCTLLAPHG